MSATTMEFGTGTIAGKFGLLSSWQPGRVPSARASPATASLVRIECLFTAGTSVHLCAPELLPTRTRRRGLRRLPPLRCAQRTLLPAGRVYGVAGAQIMGNVARTVFLFDVDNTLLDNDAVQNDLSAHLEREVGLVSRDRYWEIFEQLRSELGYADYLGAPQRYRLEHQDDPQLMRVSLFLLDY